MSLTKAAGAIGTPEVLCLWIHGPIFRNRCLSGVYTDRSLAIHHMNETVHNDAQIYEVSLETRTGNMPNEPVSVLRHFQLTAQRNGGEACPCDKCCDTRACRSTKYQGGPMLTDGKPALAASAAATRQIDLEDLEELPDAALMLDPPAQCIACNADLDEYGACPACAEREEAEIEAAVREQQELVRMVEAACTSGVDEPPEGWAVADTSTGDADTRDLVTVATASAPQDLDNDDDGWE